MRRVALTGGIATGKSYVRARIAAAGVPTVVFGPGSIEQAHTVDEWIEVVQVDIAATALVDAVS